MHHQFFERSGRVDGGGDAPRRPDPPKPLAPRSRRRNRERADAEYERGVRREVQQAPGHADDGRPHPRQRAPQTRVDPHRAARAQIVDEHVRDVLTFPQSRVPVLQDKICLLYTSPSPRDATLSRMPSSA